MTWVEGCHVLYAWVATTQALVGAHLLYGGLLMIGG